MVLHFVFLCLLWRSSADSEDDCVTANTRDPEANLLNGVIRLEISYMDVLIRIKRAVLAGRYAFSEKARIEMETDDLTELDVAESILNAVAIYKRLRSSSPSRSNRREYLYVIQSTNLDGLVIYTKGKLVQEAEVETYYFLVSSKRAT